MSFTDEQISNINYHISSILKEVGEPCDLNRLGMREGVKDTPLRVAKFYEAFLNPPKFVFTTFDSEGMDEMICETNIPFYSLCEHHILPFFGIASIAYIPNGRIAGLSKLPRLLDQISRNLQNQERITMEVANCIEETLEPLGVGVILQARHMCMEMRGVQKPGVYTTTSATRGVFRTDTNCRQEFLHFHQLNTKI